MGKERRCIGVVVSSHVAGGGERYLTNLYGGLRGVGWHGWLLGQVPGWPRLGLPAHPVVVGPKWSRRITPGQVARIPARRRRVLRAAVAEATDRSTVGFHLQYKQEQLLLTRRLRDRSPVVWTEHGVLPAGRGGAALRTAYRRAAGATACIVCVSEGVRADVRAAVASDRVRVEVIENGVDVDRFAPADEARRRRCRADVGVADDALVAVYAGRLERYKRVDLAVAAIRAAGGVLLVAGDGPQRAELERDAPGPDVRFLGHVDDPAVLYGAADVLVYPSAGSGEGLPMAVLEGAAAGLPIVAAADSGPLAATLAPVARLSDPSALAFGRAVRDVARTDEGAAARQWAESRSSARWLATHAALFDEVFARG